MQLLLLLAAAPLVLGACPPQLADIDERLLRDIRFDPRISHIKPLIDVACGRKAFALEFWLWTIVEKVMQYVAVEQIMRQPPSICTAECIENTDKKYHIRAFTPLINSVRDAMNAIDNMEAAKYVPQMYNFSIAFAFNTADWNNARPQFILDEFRRRMDVLPLTKLSTEAEAAIFRAMRRGFGIEDTVESRFHSISVAMKVLQTAEYPKHAVVIVSQIENARKLVENTRGARGMFAFNFLMFEMRVDSDARKWKKLVEILPAAEILYMQYVTLKNEEANAFIESFLTLLKEQYEITGSAQHLGNQKHDQPLFDGLSPDARSALESTFPELFAFLYKNDYILKKKNLEIY